jgi:hypothetical protein
MRKPWRVQPQSPQRALATYLGKDDGHHRWSIEGQTYTGSVSTVGGGTPQELRTYPAWCNQPDSRSQWVALVKAGSEPKILPKEFVDPEVQTANWICWGADFSRSWSWTSVTFDPAEAAALGAVPTLFPRRELRVEDAAGSPSYPTPAPGPSHSPGVYRLGVSGFDVDSDFQSGSMVSPGSVWSQWDIGAALQEWEDAQETGITIEAFNVKAAALSAGVAYLDIQMRYEFYDENEDSTEERVRCWLLAVRINSSNTDEVLWISLLNPVHTAKPDFETVVTPTRCVSLITDYVPDGRDPEAYGAYFVIRDKWTGDVIGSVEFDSLALGPYSGQIFSAGERIYVTDIDRQSVGCIDLIGDDPEEPAPSVAWVRAAGAGKIIQILGMTDESLICYYEEQLYQEYLSQSVNTQAGEPGTVTDRARGLSLLRGLQAISLATGTPMGSSVFEGSEPGAVVDGDITRWALTFDREVPLVVKGTRWIFGNGPAAPAGPPYWYEVEVQQPQSTAWDGFLIPRYGNSWALLHTPPDEETVDEEGWPKRLPMPPTALQTYQPASTTAPEVQPDRDWYDRLVDGYLPEDDPGDGLMAGSLGEHRAKEWEILQAVRAAVADGATPTHDSVKIVWPNSIGTYEAGSDYAGQVLDPAEPWSELSFRTTEVIAGGIAEYYQQPNFLGVRRPKGPPPSEESPLTEEQDYWEADSLWPIVPHQEFLPYANDFAAFVTRQPWFAEVSANLAAAAPYVSLVSSGEHQWRAFPGEKLKIFRKFSFMAVERVETEQTPMPPLRLSPAPSAGDRVVLGPVGRGADADSPIRWECYGRNAARLWRTDMTAGTGAYQIGDTIITQAQIHTFMRHGADANGICVTLSLESGAIVSTDSCPLALVQGCIFDGYRRQFVSRTGNVRWGLDL